VTDPTDPTDPIDPIDGPDLPLPEGSAAEQRREAQREQIGAARRARVSAAVPWLGVGALAVAAVACFVFALRGGPVQVPPVPGGTSGDASGGTLTFERALPSPDATPGAPAGIAVSGDRVYVADPRRGVVDVLTREGSRTATIGEGWLTTPAYVAVGPVDGRVYVSDRTRGEVGVFSATGQLMGVLAPGGLTPEATSGPTWRPLALSFAPDGTLYVADSGAQQSIAVFSPAGSRTGTLGADVPSGRTGKPFAFVNGIAATADRVVVADSNNGRLLSFDRTGRFTGAIDTGGMPRGVAVTASGRIVMTDAASDAVTLLDAAGAQVQALTGGVGGQERFVSPAGISAGSDGALYVTDAATGQVFVLGTGEDAAGSGPLPAAVRWLLLAVGVAACAAAIWLSFLATKRARARVRARGHAL
jgi:DNA-binding beta-propeller fold protein YncE